MGPKRCPCMVSSSCAIQNVQCLAPRTLAFEGLFVACLPCLRDRLIVCPCSTINAYKCTASEWRNQGAQLHFFNVARQPFNPHSLLAHPYLYSCFFPCWLISPFPERAVQLSALAAKG